MAVVTMKSLLESGVHFGHQTKRWNPKMARFIFTERNGIHIIDLQKTSACIVEAYEAVRAQVNNKKQILFVFSEGIKSLFDFSFIKSAMDDKVMAVKFLQVFADIIKLIFRRNEGDDFERIGLF